MQTPQLGVVTASTPAVGVPSRITQLCLGCLVHGKAMAKGPIEQGQASPAQSLPRVIRGGATSRYWAQWSYNATSQGSRFCLIWPVLASASRATAGTYAECARAQFAEALDALRR